MSEGENQRSTMALERIGKVLAALYASHLDDFDQGAKAVRLSRCGFANNEIADILGTTANTIGVALHQVRKKSEQKKASKGKRKR